LLVTGGVVFALGFLWRFLGTSATPRYLAEWLPPMILSGIGVGLVLPALVGASTYSLSPHRFAVGSGVNQSLRQIGSVIGVAVVVALVGAARGSAALPEFLKVFLLVGLGGLATGLISV